jgi:four helix bundle protein
MATFEDLRAFQHALDLMVDVYTVTANFPRHELYGLTSQMRRASCSVVSNIAEGQGRLTFGERRQLLSHARGSLYEVQAQVIAAQRLDFLTPEAADPLRKRAEETARELAGLIRWVKNREFETKRRRYQKARTPNA